MEKSQLTEIYYDGLCHLCSREIDHYRRSQGADQLRFIDITAPDFDAKALGLDPYLVHKFMHVRRADGQVVTGVEAFTSIWEVLPNYRWSARVAKLSVLQPFLRLGYRGFAELRPYLPRKKDACANSPYCETHSQPRGST